MKRFFFYTFLIGLGACLLFSCEMKKDLWGEKPDPSVPKLPENAGMLDLKLLAEKEAALPTKADEGQADSLFTDSFSVAVYDSTNTQVAFYETYAELKSDGGLLLTPGTYTLRAEKGEDVVAAFEKPYYAGADTFEIVAQKVAQVETPCRLSNKKVTFRYSESFLEGFEEDYSIVLDNGNGVLTLNKEEQRAAFLQNTGMLRMSMYVTTKLGEPLVYNMDLAKNEQIQAHNNIVIDLDIVQDGGTTPGGGEDPDEPEDPGDEGKPDVPTRKPVIRVDVTLIEKDFIIEVPSENVGGGDEPSGEVTKPTFTATKNGSAIDLTQAVDATSSDNIIITIQYPTGVETMTVDATVIVGGAPISMPIDMFNPGDLASVLEGNLPTKGQTVFNFKLAGFMSMMGAGTNTFVIETTDKDGSSGSCKLELNMQ